MQSWNHYSKLTKASIARGFKACIISANSQLEAV